MSRRSRSSGQWLQQHFSDPFVQRARSGGWRSRAVFKLEEIDRRERLFKAGSVCLDLGAAPGAWSQYARSRVGRTGRVVASDLLDMAALPGVEFVRGDLGEEQVLAEILRLLPGRTVDVVLSDMAPNLSGMDVIDQPRSMRLAELALETAGQTLKPGGAALIKLFQGAGFRELVESARGRFARVKLIKPQASRSRSAEMYLLAMQFRLV
jgi:23S rRNA (uridine2552-2'-O)-methyltransferase